MTEVEIYCSICDWEDMVELRDALWKKRCPKCGQPTLFCAKGIEIREVLK